MSCFPQVALPLGSNPIDGLESFARRTGFQETRVFSRFILLSLIFREFDERDKSVHSGQKTDVITLLGERTVVIGKTYRALLKVESSSDSSNQIAPPQPLFQEAFGPCLT